jgi:hypothetical protein
MCGKKKKQNTYDLAEPLEGKHGTGEMFSEILVTCLFNVYPKKQ